jgi:hypothetical protein
MSEWHVLRLDYSFVNECHNVLVTLADQNDVKLRKSKEPVESESELVESVKVLLNHGRELLDEKRREQVSVLFPKSLPQYQLSLDSDQY